jgi:sterol desaturase/sphingolipid hydroxylase (fatty acid hydroxylase superfamily)
MDEILKYFATLDSKPLHRLLFMVLPILILWFVENGFPLFKLKYKTKKLPHALINLTYTLFHVIIHGLLAVFLVKVSIWCQDNHFGMVNWLGLPVWGIVVAGVFSMDFFGGWLVHWVEHHNPIFWRIHILHHSETKVDVTSGLRHHPLEALNRWLFFTAGVFLMGLPIYAVMIGQTFMSMFTMLTHANISLPRWLDKAMSYFFVSPNMHKVHHHWQQPYTDSNFGTALSIWDRLFGTYRELDPSKIRYGLDHYFDNTRDEEFGTLMKSPFENTAPAK